MKIQKNKNQHFVTIPQDIIKATGWGKGTSVAISMYPNGDVIMRKI